LPSCVACSRNSAGQATSWGHEVAMMV
jgi:hypothetical protein